ncbi:MAG: Serine-type D-Ala-D-Ala carboxypeptidase [Parcubacteria group bacterium GW2011_GWA2_43_11]|nr:MAG: Serine-type D-Ala-D-Ala carboxypeptidase [Parcubacteria group bacterium GW2011_GWC2_42_11]KKS86204.1 MAG: Serine-type D-Ala-D-Ala carboxypeptidase [Parcubacteria group bacterium GW2011_GWA2_43_11]
MIHTENNIPEGDTKLDHTLYIPARAENETVKYEGNHVKEKIFAMIGAFAVTGLVAVSAVAYWQPKEKKEVTAVVPVLIENVPKPPDTVNPFQTLDIEAKSAVVYDIYQNTVLYGLREQEQMPLASLTKLMTALVATETLDQQKNIAISQFALETEGDSGFLVNESWNIRDLISFTMVTSSNDGADALAAAAGSLFESTPSTSPEYAKVDAFVKKMNSRAHELGLQNTTYVNATGLDEGYRNGGVGTAQDMSTLMTYIWEHEPQAILHTDMYSHEYVSSDGFLHSALNTNEYVNTIPGLQGSKTGYTDLAGGNLAIVYDAGLNHPIVIVVLGSSREGRFSDVDTLVDATYEYIASGWYEYDLLTAGSTSKI